MKIIRKNLKVILVVLGLIITHVSFAQDISISGTVTDQETGEPLPGVTIVVKGTTIGTITNFDGIYNLNVEKGATLQYSYIGYETIEQVAGDQTTINIALALDTEQLDEVVVIGYGQIRKEDATGSVSSVSSSPARRDLFALNSTLFFILLTISFIFGSAVLKNSLLSV